ncbi:Kinesin-like protein KIF20B [Leucoagaricus sp. SymC.cos]|nr:Kinesin-like protein KIF20B [Leucoagaricus sp. SymC.cos]
MTTRASSRNKVPSIIPAAPAPTSRTTRTKTTSKSTTPTPSLPTTTKRTATAKKPLTIRENSTVSDGPSKAKSKPASTRKNARATATQSTDREPIMAYLRIRPHLGDEEPASAPYLTPLSDTSVRMTEPQDNGGNRARFRSSALSGSSLYTFSHIFPPETTQSDFFTKTTLPLVQDVLQGQNGLLFTYGVTNSGKTYTVQGGSTRGSAGILPRTLDVIFNSIESLQGGGKYRPVRLYGIEPSDANDTDLPQMSTEPALAEVLGQLESTSEVNSDIDPTSVRVDRNYEYTVWLSYVEVYNEKVYDLLGSVKDESSDKTPLKTPADPKLLLMRQALPLRPSPASDNGDAEINGKYISGLRQFRVTSAAQAKSIVKLGQLHRRVFGTLANHQSSRSHGMVIIKIVRGHRGEKDDPTSLQVSRLTLVDLAGSERTKHTHTTGERLKEAGNINKSLMVLGQCMEVMRSNQKKLAASLAYEGSGKDGRMDTRDVRKTLAVIPFRHSKLTEALMDYFTGEGRAVMIVNVNPYDTGYDENSHVMKFSALAREVYITNAPAPVHKVPSLGPGKLQGQKFKDLTPMTMNDPEVNPNPFRRKVTITMGKKSEAVLEVVEEDEPVEDVDDNDDEPLNPLIDALFDEVENLRMQLFEAEMRCAIIEAETREEVMREMEERMRLMEEKYSRRLMSEFEQNELKTDAKIDMLHKAGLLGSPIKQQRFSIPTFSDEEEEDEAADVEMSLMNQDERDSDLDDDEEMPLSSPPNDKAVSKSKTKPTPNAGKSAKGKMPNHPPPEQEDTEMGDLTEDQEDENGLSSIGKTSKAGKQAPAQDLKKSKQPRVSKLERDMKELSIKDKGKISVDLDDSVEVIPAKLKKMKKIVIDSDSEEERKVSKDDEDELSSVPVVKKKRQLGKKPVMTLDNIERVTWEVEKKVARTQGHGTIRRLTGD